MWDGATWLCSSVGVPVGSDGENRGRANVSVGMVDLEPTEQSGAWRQIPRIGLVEQACCQIA